MSHHSEQGYSLIVSIIIISTVLLLAGVVTARQLQDGFFASVRLNQFTQSELSAQGCADVALLRIATDSSYAGNEVVDINGNSCTILPIIGSIIEIESQNDEQVYRLRVSLSNIDPPQISKWERVADF